MIQLLKKLDLIKLRHRKVSIKYFCNFVMFAAFSIIITYEEVPYKF